MKYYKTPQELRQAVREGKFKNQTSGQAKGFVQANLVILPESWAYDFLLFSQRNPKPCPVLEVGDTGSFKTKYIAKDGDIRTDIPKYRIYKNGNLIEERQNIIDLWQNNFVFFLLGCSFSFEQALLEAGLEIRHISSNKNVPMYNTNIMCKSAGKFKETPMVVSMRPFTPEDAVKATEITHSYPSVHGCPIHLGNPEKIGIKDINTPDYGDSVNINYNEIPVFWACGVTPQKAAMIAKPPLMITHSPGYMFVGDFNDKEFKV
ncbi:MAG TPA: putative hydro-lyase [Victivallales bacterium]|nr:putative hydro-lyase [Victivallales bacterium]